MDWIEKNLDAYRVIAEILSDLRPIVRERLEAAHGKEWFRDGIPSSVFDRLIHNKEEEASIDWYENRYQEVISYAVFPDLFEIIDANPGLFDPILKLAPSTSLLNTRFLELEVMRSKLGRTREISEAEINFLTSFHLRFRKAIAEIKNDDSQPELRAPIPESGKASRAADEPNPDPSSAAVSSSEHTAPTAISRDEPPPTSDAVDQADPGHSGASADTAPTEEQRPPMRMASSSNGNTAEPEPAAAQQVEATPEADDEIEIEEVDTPRRETRSASVKRALEGGDDQAVLRELYREITGLAEVIWTTEEIPTTAIWDRVSTSSWYEKAFSRLSLRPVSDFYELIGQVRKKRSSGTSRKEIQTFLNESKFANILLALRDMFQANKI